MTGFYNILSSSWKQQNSLLCVGLDADMDRLPKTIRKSRDPLFSFNKEIIDATAQWVCAYKPQIAYYSAIGAERQLEKTIHYIKTEYPGIPVILDAKRGDIGSTATMYAREAYDRYQADAVTVNPYMGGDTITPFLSYKTRGVIILCRTSNPGSEDVQTLVSDNLPVYQHVARLAVSKWNENRNVALVIGATYPEVIGEVRNIVGNMPLLVPGIGTQGGDLSKVLSKGLTENQNGLIVNVSRSIIYASEKSDFCSAAADQAKLVCEQINQLRIQ